MRAVARNESSRDDDELRRSCSARLGGAGLGRVARPHITWGFVASSVRLAQLPADRSLDEDRHEVLHRILRPAIELRSDPGLDRVGRHVAELVGEIAAYAIDLELLAHD